MITYRLTDGQKIFTRDFSASDDVVDAVPSRNGRYLGLAIGGQRRESDLLDVRTGRRLAHFDDVWVGCVADDAGSVVVDSVSDGGRHSEVEILTPAASVLWKAEGFLRGAGAAPAGADGYLIGLVDPNRRSSGGGYRILRWMDGRVDVVTEHGLLF